MKLILHIGTEKTGTTSIQEWLYANRRHLKAKGICLSTKLGLKNNRKLPLYFQGRLDDWAKAKGVSTLSAQKRLLGDIPSKLRIEVEKAKKNSKVFLITSEHLHSRLVTVEEIESLYHLLIDLFDEVKVICYFRDQFDLAVSRYSTALRMQNTLSIDSFVSRITPRNYFFNYLQAADAWSEVFGHENCLFKIFDKELFYENNLIKDFVKETDLDIGSSVFAQPIETSNQSLSLLQAAAYRVINQTINYWKPNGRGVNKENKLAKEMVLLNEAFAIGQLSGSNREEIAKRFKKSNKKFFETYFSSDQSFRVSNTTDWEPLTAEQCERAVAEAFKLGFDLGKLGNVTGAVRMLDEDINLIRDLALKIEAREPLDIADAIFLMKIAMKNRPEGPLIKKKLRDWTK